jgi:hypothetical protein
MVYYSWRFFDWRVYLGSRNVVCYDADLLTGYKIKTNFKLGDLYTISQ